MPPTPRRQPSSLVPLLLALAAAVAAALVALSAHAYDGDRGEPALGGFDPVHLVAGEEVTGDDRFTAEHGLYRYRFASDETRERFLADPERYAIQGDGQCPVSPSATADPALFAVHEGKIYTFTTRGCIERFRQSPDYYIARNVDLDAEAPASGPTVRRVAILLYDGVELLDFAGPGEVFAAAGSQLFDVYTVAAADGPIVSQGFVTVEPQHTFDTAPPADVLVVPGGQTRGPINDERTVVWIRRSAERAEVTMSVCTGAFLLARAGLLDDREITTHWLSLDRLAEMVPAATVRRERRFVDAGPMVTAAGVSAGIDASLHVVERLIGPHTAANVARYMEYEGSWGGRGDGAEREGRRVAASPGR